MEEFKIDQIKRSYLFSSDLMIIVIR